MIETPKIDGIRNLLLGPLALAAEIIGGLIPGILFLLLLISKRVPEAVAAMGSNEIGYKTKLACALVVCFVIGRLFYIPASLFNYWISTNRSLKIFDETKTGTLSERLTPQAMKVLGGLFITPLITETGKAAEYVAVAYAEVYFRLSTGLVLIVASMIPGDGRMRLWEAVAGVLLSGYGVVATVQARGITLGMFGSVAVSALANSTEEQRKVILPLLPILMRVLSYQEKPSNAAGVSPSAATAGGAPVSPPTAGLVQEELGPTLPNAGTEGK